MSKALVVIDIQNDITKNYKGIIDNLNASIDWASKNNVDIIYIRHENLSAGTRTFKPNTKGAELAPDLNVINNNIFTKTKGNALTSLEFANYIESKGLDEFFVSGADAVACVKSTVFNMCKLGYKVNVLSDCVTSYDKRKISEMIEYYKNQGATIMTLEDLLRSSN
jgi:nicotinamidase-related amidase